MKSLQRFSRDCESMNQPSSHALLHTSYLFMQEGRIGEDAPVAGVMYSPVRVSAAGLGSGLDLHILAQW